MKGLAFVFTVFAAVLGLSTASRCGKLPACDDVNLTRYAGIWYEQARSDNLWFEKNCECVTANYTQHPTNPSRIIVNNGCTRNNDTSIAFGIAKVAKPCELKVKFPPSPFWGGYRVVSTDYDTYAVVASCGWWWSRWLNWDWVWILSRQPILPETKMDEILRSLKEANFDYDDMYRTPQGEKCIGQGYPY